MLKYKDKKFVINTGIPNHRIRIVDENIVLNRDEAIQLSIDRDLDLILLNTAPDGTGLCKMIDYQKFLYERKKKQKENEKNQVQQKLKEVRFTPVIGDHDYNFKVKQIIEFLKAKNKVKVGVFFQGRMITHLDAGKILIEQIINDISDVGKPENEPKMEGKRMLLMLQPR